MSQFSSMLDSYIYESNLSVNEISVASGIDRTYISKLRSGARIIRDEKKIKQLVMALRCSSEQEQQLMREYRIEAMGRARYEIIETVKDLLQNVGNIPSKPFIRPEQALMNLSGPVYGKNDVSSVLKTILDEESARESGHIRLVAQHSFDALVQLLPGVCHNNTSLWVEHITSLHSSNTNRADLNNVNSLRAFLSPIICGCNYDFLYYYGEQSHINSMSLFPYLVITTRHAMAVSYSGDSALLFDDADIRESYVRVFENKKLQCRPIISKLSLGRRFAEYEHRFRESAANGNTLLALSSTPALTPFISEDMLKKYMRIKDMGTMELMGNLLMMYREVSTHPTVKFFSEEGIKYFMRHGRISGIPDSFYAPVEPHDRLVLLKRWHGLCQEGTYRCIAVQPNQLALPHNMFVEVTDVSSVMFSYTHPRNHNSFYMVLEQSICTCMYEFLHYLNKGNLVYDEGRSMAIASTLISGYEQELGRLEQKRGS